MAITQFKHSPSDKRNPGLTFLGMQAQEGSHVEGDYVSRHEYEFQIGILKEDIATLWKIVHRKPWYRKLWEWMTTPPLKKRSFRMNERK